MQLRSRTARGENLGQTGNISQPHMGSSVKLEIFFFLKHIQRQTENEKIQSTGMFACLVRNRAFCLFLYFFISKGGGFLLTCVNSPRSTGGSSSEENLAASFLFFFGSRIRVYPNSHCGVCGPYCCSLLRLYVSKSLNVPHHHPSLIQ